ncbi:MAG: hypothetical protein WCV58_04190 [Patescibacteria group bacterium]
MSNEEGKDSVGQPVPKQSRQGIPEAADYIFMFSVAGRIGYIFLSDPIKQISSRIISGIDTGGMKFVMMGGTCATRQLTSQDITLKDAFSGLLKQEDFSGIGNNISSSATKYIACFRFNGKSFVYQLRKMVEVISEREIVLTGIDNSRFVVSGDNLEMYCRQVAKDNDDNNNTSGMPDPYNLKDLRVKA